MNKDWIQESKEVAAELKVAGFENEPRIIMDAVESGSTGGEIYMNLRWKFREIMKDDIIVDDQIRVRIDHIIKGITVALGD